MIKATELRIGNYIDCKYTGEGFIINGDFDAVEVNMSHLEDIEFGSIEFEYKPIQLTEEWLIKFGFHKYADEYWSNGNIQIPLMDKIGGGELLLSPYKNYALEIKHVHQLQNLYFALTGEELTTN